MNIITKIQKRFYKIMIAGATLMLLFVNAMAASAAAANNASNAGGNNGVAGGPNAAPTQTADQTFTDVLQLIFRWIGYGGLALAAFGGIMLALAIKDNNGDGKQKAIWELIAGFVVFAITGSLDLFGIV
jgi:hypothetical protein